MAYSSLFKTKKDPPRASFLAALYLYLLFPFFGAAPRFAQVAPLRSSQLCSALRRLRLLGRPPLAALLWAAQPAALRACKTQNH